MLAAGPDDHTLDPSENSQPNSTQADSSSVQEGETLGTNAAYTPGSDSSFATPRPIGPYRLVRKLPEPRNLRNLQRSSRMAMAAQFRAS